MLEKNFNNKVIIRDITQTAYASVFVKAFQSTHVVSGTPADLRWGVIFYSRGGTRLGAVYFDKFGRRGAVDELSVSLGGDFFGWLNDTFSKCLQ